MVRNYVSKKNLRYTPEDLTKALQAISSNEMSVYKAGKTFGVPLQTLYDRVKAGTLLVEAKPGVGTVFSSAQEDALVQRLIDLCRRGFPITIKRFRSIVFTFAARLNRRGKLQNVIPAKWKSEQRAGRYWWEGFKKRHADLLSLRIPEGLSAARAAAFNPARVRSFFQQLTESFERFGLQDYPQLIYNIDETGLTTVPNSKIKVIAPRGMSTVQKLTAGERGELTTICPGANAIGQFIPPFIVAKGSKCADDFRASLPGNFKVVWTKSGYMDAIAFGDFLRHFDNNRVKIDAKSLFLLFCLLLGVSQLMFVCGSWSPRRLLHFVLNLSPRHRVPFDFGWARQPLRYSQPCAGRVSRD
jgi:hypothetical protein